MTMDTRTRTERILRTITEVPTLPEVVNRLLDLINDPDSSAGDLARLVEQDPALSAQILKMVNSSFYGLAGKIGSIQRSIVILGFNTVKQLALGVSVIDFFDVQGDALFQPRLFWAHSLRTATAAKIIGDRTRDPALTDCFTPALLHDIGKMIEHQHLAEDFARIARLAQLGKIPFHEAERQILGLDHARLGERVCEHWRFPAEVREPIGLHHDPDGKVGDATTRKRGRLIYAANLIAHRIENAADGEPRPTTIAPAVLAELKIGRKDEEPLIEQIGTRADEVIASFQ